MLWTENTDPDLTDKVRVAYMDTLTSLVKENYSMQIGRWCDEHNVEYIGHIVEDMGSSAGIGASLGHYFRSMAGMHMGGMDVIGGQYITGGAYRAESEKANFYHFTLGKLGTSYAHLDPRKNGHSMIELFGAYGWEFGVRDMKMLADHFLVSGVNRFVPHAFSPKYPDPDCPPHFNAGGCNPQFSGFTKLMHYTNKTVHLLEGGEIVSAAILYNAEAEWSGRDYMLMQKPAKVLYDAQLNYDFLPADAIAQAHVENGALCLGEMRYPALIVPYSAYLPAALIKTLNALAQAGLKVAFVGGRTAGCTGGDVIALEETAAFVRAAGGEDVRIEPAFPLLRVLHKRRDGADVFMLVNESMTEDFAGTVHLPVEGEGVRLDLLLDSACRAEAKGGALPLSLGKGQSVLFVFGTELPQGLAAQAEYRKEQPLCAQWTLSLKDAEGGDWSEAKPIDALVNITGPQGDMEFSGWMRYETEFEADGAQALDLGFVGECAHVWLNGVDLGERIDAPYVFDCSGAMQPGKNTLVVETANSLVYRHPDPFSLFMQIPPSGLLGPVRLLSK